jgi:hypothetical protein
VVTALRIRIAAGIVLGVSLLALAVLPAQGQFFGGEEITSSGPLSRIMISDTLSCQVAHRDDDQFEFFPSSSEIGDCGTFLGLGGSVWGPAGGSATRIPWTPVSQTPVAGNGSSGDPFRIVTTVDLPEARLQIQETDSYIVGSQSYRTDVLITNVGNAGQTGFVFRAADCYLQGDDTGLVSVDNGAPACIVDPTRGRRIEQWTPITPGSHFFAGPFGEVWSLVGSQQNFPDRCECDAEFPFDNGAGLSWELNLAPGASATYSHETFFSPVGRGPVQQQFKDSVPDPTRITLDPIVVAQTVAITAGVIVLVPFPSALFNSTLEDNYDEVMAWLARVRAWLSRMVANLRAWIRRRLDERRAARAGPAASTASSAPVGAPGAPAPVETASAPVAAGTSEPEPVPEPVAAPPAETPPPSASASPAQDVWRTPLGVIGFVLLSALLYSFLDPTFGLSEASLASFVGLAVGLFVVIAAYGIPLFYFARKHQLKLTVRALPATLAIGLLCVVISRIVNFQPGYLYGLIIGFLFAQSVTREQEGPAEASAAAASLVAAFVAWIGLFVLRANPTVGDELLSVTLQAGAATIVVAGLENAVFAMLPLRFLPGAAVFNWKKRIWLVIIALGLFGFAHVLLNPASGTGYLADTTRSSFFTLIALLVAFGIASVLFWGYFRFRPKRGSPAPTGTTG